MFLDSTLVQFLGSVPDPDRSIVVNRYEHLVPVLVKQINIDGQIIIEEAELESKVLLERLLPLDCLVGAFVLDDVSVTVLGILTDIQPSVFCIVASDKTRTVTDLELAEPRFCLFEEWLFGDYPSYCA